MTRTRISPSLLAWVTHRRTRGDQWKLIERDLRDAGLPACRQQYHAARDPQARRERGAERARVYRARRSGCVPVDARNQTTKEEGVTTKNETGPIALPAAQPSPREPARRSGIRRLEGDELVAALAIRLAPPTGAPAAPRCIPIQQCGPYAGIGPITAYRIHANEQKDGREGILIKVGRSTLLDVPAWERYLGRQPRPVIKPRGVA